MPGVPRRVSENEHKGTELRLGKCRLKIGGSSGHRLGASGIDPGLSWRLFWRPLVVIFECGTGCSPGLKKTDAAGDQLAASLTGGNRHDSTQLFPLLDAIPRVRGAGRGRPRGKPKTVYADRAYDYPVFRQTRRRVIQPKIAKRGTPHGSGLGKVRYVVERTFARLHGMRRLRIRYERRADIHEAFLKLGVCVIALRHVIRLC
jgi:transposase